MLLTHLLIVDVLSYSNMEWYDDEPMVYAYSLCLFWLEHLLSGTIIRGTPNTPKLGW
jgi:hypothetical protein